MGNMSYCRFENTNPDLDDCVGALEDFLCGDEKINDDELVYAARVVDKCAQAVLSLANFKGQRVGDFITEMVDGDPEEFVKAILLEARNNNNDRDDPDEYHEAMMK